MSLSRSDLLQRMSLPLDAKIAMTRKRIQEWEEYWDQRGSGVFVAFSGGKDSTVLLHIVRGVLGAEVPAVFYQTGVEYPEINAFVRSVPNVVMRRSEIGWGRVLKEHGYPVVSKQASHALEMLQNPTEKNAASRHFYLTGEKRDGTKVKPLLAKKWHYLANAPFPISEDCCDILKKGPAVAYERETNRKPFVGTLAEESRMRKWKAGNCNAYDARHPVSRPMSFWTGQDVLEYIVANGLPIASVYGEIVRGPDGLLQTTGEERTGCVGCMFGAERKGRDGLNRFQRLFITHPKLWRAYTEGMGLREILAHMKIPVDPPSNHPLIRDDVGPEGLREERLVTLGAPKRPTEAPADPARNEGVEAPAAMTFDTTEEKRPPPVHLYCRREGQLAVIGCGKAVSMPRQYTDDVKKASCRSCAKYAPGLTDEQRDEIWENAADRLGRSHSPPSPWMKKKLKAKRELEKIERKKTLEQERLLRDQRRAERQARKAATAS